MTSEDIYTELKVKLTEELDEFWIDYLSGEYLLSEWVRAFLFDRNTWPAPSYFEAAKNIYDQYWKQFG